MACKDTASRRRFLTNGLIAAAVGSLAVARPTTGRTAEPALLNPNDPAAKALKYTEDAGTVKGIPAGNKCSNCALYEGSYTSSVGACQAFPGKQVKAAGWCTAWAAQI